MNKNFRNMSFMLLALLFLLVFIAVPAKAQQIQATIKYTFDNGEKISIDFTKNELKKVKKDSKFVLEKLEMVRVKCPTPNKKIGPCEWKCGDGSYIYTCNVTLKKALGELLSKSNAK